MSPAKTCLPMAAVIAMATGCLLTDPITTSDRERVENAEQRWASVGPASYTFRYTRSCFCDPRGNGPATITVTDGVITAAVLDSGEQPVLDSFPTVDELFILIVDALDIDPHKLHVEFGDTLGEPLTIDIDYRADTVDDEMVIHISALTPAEINDQ